MDDKKKNMILIPPKFGNAHYVLSEKAIFHYKQNTQEIKNEKSSNFWWIWFVGINLTKFLAKKNFEVISTYFKKKNQRE